MKSINDSLVAYFDDVERYALKISPTFNAEDIHKYRTATKKLRTMLRWHPVGDDIISKSFKKSYHISGDLRNAQLLLISVGTQGLKLPGFLLWLATSIGRLEHEWIHDFRKSSLRKLRRKLVSLNDQHPSAQELQGFFENKINEVREILRQASPPDEVLHDIRKMTKDMLYLRQWCRKNWPEGWKATKSYPVTQLKKLAELAGNYNDRSTWLTIVSEYLRDERNPVYKRAALSMQKKDEKEKLLYKKELISHLVQFSGKFKEPSNAAVGN